VSGSGSPFSKAEKWQDSEYIIVNCVCPGQIYAPFWEWLEWVTSEKTKVEPEAKGMTSKEYFDKIVAPHDGV